MSAGKWLAKYNELLLQVKRLHLPNCPRNGLGPCFFRISKVDHALGIRQGCQQAIRVEGDSKLLLVGLLQAIAKEAMEVARVLDSRMS